MKTSPTGVDGVGSRVVRVLWRPLAALAVVAGSSGLMGCESAPKPRPRAVVPVVREVPPLLRGTIGAEATVLGAEPVLVSGLGFVVGLNGTGGQALPDRIAATMEREMGLQGIGKAGDFQGTAIEGLTPRQLLRHPDTAVVLVQAAIPPGAPEGATFDVYVRALNASSIEGGTLWSTDLRLGAASVFGAVQAQQLGMARGAIFINPFAEPGKRGASVTPTLGRVLEGGLVTSPLELALVLDNPSFSRARSIVEAIKNRFPEGPGDSGPAARGISGGDAETGAGGRIAMRVPARYRERAADFLNIVRAMQIDQQFPEEYARRYAEGLKNEPALAEPLSYSLEAIGPKAVPFLRDLYTYGERVPRVAALRAGARLGDTQAAGHLVEIAREGATVDRVEAIRLLGDLDAGPTVDVALREFLSTEDLLVRVAAYEALAQRAERAQLARLIASANSRVQNPAERVSFAQLELLSQASLSGGIQGVRRSLAPGKFVLDQVPGGSPLIYITQQGRPRIVLFGDPLIVRPLLVSAWSDRLLLTADGPQDPLRVYYRDDRSGQVTQTTASPVLASFVAFAADTTTPEDPTPGLGLSYSETVSALYALYQAGGTTASFATERDRLLAGLTAAAQSPESRDRPETPNDKEEVVVFDQPVVTPGVSPASPQGPRVVPIEPVDPKQKKRN